ncbi:uncharacterized protein [Euphorbia lathyris]|uniref:uncharacterized protein n=1 Tax=Euphorbia lathyris TaxID=212925 RepID=UPI0033140B95
MEKEGEAIEQQINQNWSEAVEDLVSSGDTDAAISLLETLVLQLETLSPSETVSLQLASALTELSKLFSANNFSLKSDQLLSRATILQQRALHSCPSGNVEAGKKGSSNDKDSQPNAALSFNDLVPDGNCVDVHLEESSGLLHDASPCNGSSDDDWEAIADRPPNELLSSPGLPSVSNLSLEDTKSHSRKQRGRGTFTYKQDKLYSDQQSDISPKVAEENEDLGRSVNVQQDAESIHSKYGTRHVLVIANFPPSTKTIDLENLFQEFKDCVVVIRWVSDTVALAVFQKPSLALEAMNKIHCPFTMRILEDDDILLSSIPAKDVEPPRRRPQTSARTAQRLIAQGMGLKLPLPSKTFSSKELKNQEEARKNRIVSRQKMIEDAWGADSS